MFDASFLSLLSSLALPESETPGVSGVGGRVGCLFVPARLSLVRDDGNQVFINGPFGVFADAASSDISVLGRDVTNNFDVIYSYPRHEVVLLSRPHGYEVRS